MNALHTSDETRRRFEIMAREVFLRAKALITEPAVFVFSERHDNIEAIYKKLGERRDLSDITEVMKTLHRIVNDAIIAHAAAPDDTTGITIDLSAIDFETLREEFTKNARRKQTVLQDIRDVVEKKLQAMLARNPQRMDFYKKYMEIIADYNREKERASVEDTFARLVVLAESLDEEQKRAAKEGLGEDELALFELLCHENISKKDRERVKQASRQLLTALTALLPGLEHWTEKEQTQADVQVLILNELVSNLPNPPTPRGRRGRRKASVRLRLATAPAATRSIRLRRSSFLPTTTSFAATV